MNSFQMDRPHERIYESSGSIWCRFNLRESIITLYQTTPFDETYRNTPQVMTVASMCFHEFSLCVFSFHESHLLRRHPVRQRDPHEPGPDHLLLAVLANASQMQADVSNLNDHMRKLVRTEESVVFGKRTSLPSDCSRCGEYRKKQSGKCHRD